ATDRWFHVARVDGLFLMLLLAAFCVLRLGRGTASAAFCGVLLWLSFATKQTALICAVVALPVMAFGSWRRPAVAACVLSALVLVTNAVMHAWTDGWWTFFIYDIARDQKIQWWTIYAFVTSDIGRVLPVAGVGLIAMIFVRREGERSTLWLLGLFA